MVTTIGIDPHEATHTAVAINETETILGELTVSDDRSQTETLLDWAQNLDGDGRVWAVEAAGRLGYVAGPRMNYPEGSDVLGGVTTKGVFAMGKIVSVRLALLSVVVFGFTACVADDSAPSTITAVSSTSVPPNAPSSSSSRADVSNSTSTTTTPLENTVSTALAGVPESCPVTVPGDNAFTPASEAPEGPPTVYEDVWYGTPQHWTMVNPQGAVWKGLPVGPDGDVGEKTFRWSENYSAADPGEFTVTAEHLNGSAPTIKGSKPGGSGFNPFMLAPTHESVTMVGVELPEPGCWELTAVYKGATLSYVVWVSDD
jgi:hypothetical protein